MVAGDGEVWPGLLGGRDWPSLQNEKVFLIGLFLRS
jgi:hypothetical protein